jgi:hypothetical protein
LDNSGLDVIFLTKDDLGDWILNSDPLHAAYEYLSAIHRSDYLRMYFMHHYGGGYSDVKNISKSWVAALAELKNSGAYLNGYPEIGWRGVAKVGGWQYVRLILNVNKLVGNGAYVVKPGTRFTYEWREKVNAVLDENFEGLKRHPAQHPEDFLGRIDKGVRSNYPLAWTQLLGNIFHPLCLKYSNYVLRTLDAPDFLTEY